MNKNKQLSDEYVVKEYRTTDRHQHIRLFRATLQTGLSDMNEVGFDDEKHMQKLVESNIETLFPGLKFLDTEFQDMAEGESRLDTMAFDTGSDTFVAMEYKNRLDKGVVSQAKTYLRDIEGNKGDLVLAHSKKMGCRPRDRHSFKWNEIYTIIMAPEFGPFQIIGASKDLEVELHEIKLYDDLVMTVSRVGGGHKGRVSRGTDDERMDKLYRTIHNRLLAEFPGTKAVSKDKSYSEFIMPGSRKYFCRIKIKRQKILLGCSDERAARELKSSNLVNVGNWSEIQNNDDCETAISILKGLHGDDKTDIKPIDRLYETISARLLKEFPNMAKEERKLYDRFIRDGQLLCTMGPQKARIWLHYSACSDNPAPNQSRFVTFDKYPGWGLGQWRSDIRNEADFNRALDILKNIPTD